MPDDQDNVVSLDEHRPHLVFMLEDGKVHVIPVSVFRDIVAGTLKLTDIDDWEMFSRYIIKAWLEGIGV